MPSGSAVDKSDRISAGNSVDKNDDGSNIFLPDGTARGLNKLTLTTVGSRVGAAIARSEEAEVGSRVDVTVFITIDSDGVRVVPRVGTAVACSDGDLAGQRVNDTVSRLNGGRG